MIIKNKEDWWNGLDIHWENIKEIVFHHLKPLHPAYQDPGNKETELTGRILCAELEYLKEKRDPKIHKYLNVSWCMASDSYAYSVPSWGPFCDLCSESWVFDESLDLEEKVLDKDGKI